MLSLMALLDRKRTSDLKLLKEFDYPADLSRLLHEYDLLQAFKECGEENLRLLKKVQLEVPGEFAEYFKVDHTQGYSEPMDE
ncbi:hypothetical protein ANCCAN_05975 [Ancylostoma caninum]|uniref:Uncharacterized protein n=1 Tax=Ancylostoma caninum TaxID=29170 RepID=A0A368GU84_ANCCA|nr:hypothetical protein ANCCAN_05975 [Ancylostoma caninum]